MSKTKNKPGIHLRKTTKKVWSKKKGYSVFVPSFYWNIIASNGREIARSSKTYTRKSGAVKSIRIAAEIFKDADAGQSLGGWVYFDHSIKDSVIQSYL